MVIPRQFKNPQSVNLVATNIATFTVSPLIAALAIKNRSKLCLSARQFYFRGTSSTGNSSTGTDRDELAGLEGRSSINMEFS